MPAIESTDSERTELTAQLIADVSNDLCGLIDRMARVKAAGVLITERVEWRYMHLSILRAACLRAFTLKN